MSGPLPPSTAEYWSTLTWLIDEHPPETASVTLHFPSGRPEQVDAAARAAGIPAGRRTAGHGVDVHAAKGMLAGGTVELTLMCAMPAETLGQRIDRATAELAELTRQVAAANGTEAHHG
jgi:hypothetical protein